MILIGIEKCNLCEKVRFELFPIKYIKLTKNKSKSTPEILKVKKIINRLNKSKRFPVVLNDDITKLVDTEYILKNLDKRSIANKLID